MKKFLIVSFLTAFSVGCSTAPRPTAGADAAMQKNTAPAASDNSAMVSSHSPAETPAHMPPKTDAKSSASESSPMARAVNVSEMTAGIEKAEKAFKQNQKDEKAKNKLAEAYFVRAFALTDVAQYRAALGDFRKGLKLNPNNADAKSMHDKIIDIFENSLHREPPKEGEEPPPLSVETTKNL